MTHLSDVLKVKLFKLKINNVDNNDKDFKGVYFQKKNIPPSSRFELKSIWVKSFKKNEKSSLLIQLWVSL